jgi:hypothetical protein
MSRPIAYNLPGAAINGSITNEDAVISYVVDGRGNDYFNNYDGCTWVPSADGAAPIVFVTDTFTRGYEGTPNLAVPLFFACAGTSSAAILYTANRLPGSPGNYTNANTAIEDLNKTYSYFILESNDPFQGINATDMAMDLDASKMTSYPQTANNWYDLSGNGNTGALTNGPTWDSNGWFTFDGVDDYVDCGIPMTFTTSFSLNFYFKTTTNGVKLIFGMYDGSGADWWIGTLTNGTLNFSFGSPSKSDIATSTVVTDGLWRMATCIYDKDINSIFLYLNGSLQNSSNTIPSTVIQPGGSMTIGRFGIGSAFYWPGSMFNSQLYSKAFTTTEIKQNYFGSPIVTDGLVFAVDANNIVSYPKSGTAWYNLTGSDNGTLVNGPTFSPSNGGSILFDGTDDYVSTNFTQTFADEITVECWYKGTKFTRNHLWTLGRYSGNTNLTADFNDGLGLWIYWNGGGSPAIRYTGNFTDNTIKHLVYTHSGSINKTYLNGELLTPYDVLGTQTFSPAVGGIMEIGSIEGTQLPFGGNVYSYRVYNKGLTAAEVQQNYQAEQYRFEGPAGPVTNGLLLYWDAGNLDSYPGTGTIIYDLSGNGNNGTLINGVGYNQTNGGVLTFDGVDDVVRLLAPDLRSTNNTVMGAARYTGTSPHGRMINSYGNNWLMGHWNNSTENYYAEGTIALGAGPSDTNWRIYSALGDVSGDSYSLYVNNSLSAGPNNGGSAGPWGISIGAQGFGSEYSTGNFSFVLVYNRLLTVAEMTQNYNYFKGRFGL